MAMAFRVWLAIWQLVGHRGNNILRIRLSQTQCDVACLKDNIWRQLVQVWLAMWKLVGHRGNTYQVESDSV